MKNILSLVFMIGIGSNVYFLFFHTEENLLHYNLSDNQMKEAIKILIDNSSEKKNISNESSSNSLEVYENAYASYDTNGSEQNLKRMQSIISKSSYASMIVGGYKAYTLSNSATKSQINTFLQKNGFQESYASKYSSQIEKKLHSKAFKRLSIFITATGLVLTTEEFLFTNISFVTRISIAVGIGLLIFLLYIWANKKGIMK